MWAITTVISPCPMESAGDLSGLCSQRLMSRVPARIGILPGLAAAAGRLHLYCDGKSTLVDLVGVSKLLFSGNSSYWYISKNVHKILPPAGIITLVDS
jgi:hypothetical protein